MNDSADDERAAIRETVLARNVRVAMQEHARILIAAGWQRERVEALMRTALDDAVRAHLTRRASAG